MAEARRKVVLLADDDPEDRELTRDAFGESGLRGEMRFVEDGRDLLDYLRGSGRWSNPSARPAPALILLDLNMPRMDGREALREIKSDPELRDIPVVVLTTSTTEKDVRHTYELGVNSYVTKPGTYPALVDVVRVVTRYWLEVVRLPDSRAGGRVS